MTRQLSPASPQPSSSLLRPASVYMIVSRSGQIVRPCIVEVVADVHDRGELARIDGVD